MPGCPQYVRKPESQESQEVRKSESQEVRNAKGSRNVRTTERKERQNARTSADQGVGVITQRRPRTPPGARPKV